MFNKLFKRPFTIKKHTKAPLLNERLQYLQYWEKRGRSLHTLKTIAQYLLRIVEFLDLEAGTTISARKLEKAADKWAKYQYNHPQKRISFSKCGKKRFTWYAINWLKKLNRLECLPEEKIPLFNKIFERRKALQRHTSAPLLKQRLMYLQYWSDNGAVGNSLRSIAQHFLLVMKYLNYYKLRKVSVMEIEKAANRWAKAKHYRRKSNYSKFAKARFVRDAMGWFEMINLLVKPEQTPIPFENHLNQYVAYMREEQGLSENTIKARFFILKDFLSKLYSKNKIFMEITPTILDNILIEKYNTNKYTRRTIQAYASMIRSFLRFSENQELCHENLADSIKTPRVYYNETLPYSPDWDDVKVLLEKSKTDHPTDIRDRAILMLLSIYGMRCSEVTHLRLEDLDWKLERIYLRRAKRSKPQIFPLTKIVGESILRYLKEVRPNGCALNEVFICRRSPYRPLKSAAVYQIVSKRLKPLKLKIKHYGPHALRHACATHLINEGMSLKEIADHLGHQGLDTTRIYTKVDLVNLRKIAEFNLGSLL